MKIIRKDPFREIERFFDENDDWFGFVPAIRRSLMPPMDVYQTDTHLMVEVHVPNIEPEKVDIRIEDGVLKIEGTREEEHEHKDKEYYRKEVRSGSFSRAIALPVPIKEGEVKATYEKGVLKISLPKAEKEKKGTRVDIEVK